MRRALELAGRAEQQQEVPVGALIIHGDTVLGEGWNQSIGLNDPTAHAEVIALRAASSRISNYRLPKESTLYVTLEPCAMCAGALIQARIGRVVYGAADPKSGAIHSVLNLLDNDNLNHRAPVEGGVLETSCANILKNFFQQRR
jgi:tRNA(adenine34) deaminase